MNSKTLQKSTMVAVEVEKNKAKACNGCIKNDKPERKIPPSSLRSQTKLFRKSCCGYRGSLLPKITSITKFKVKIRHKP